MPGRTGVHLETTAEARKFGAMCLGLGSAARVDGLTHRKKRVGCGNALGKIEDARLDPTCLPGGRGGGTTDEGTWPGSGGLGTVAVKLGEKALSHSR